MKTLLLANHGRAPIHELLANAMPFQVLQDNWVQIPLGDFPNAGPELPNGRRAFPGGVIQRVDQAAVETMVNEFNSIKGKMGRLFGGVPWFKGHPDMDPEMYPDKDAYGWIEAMENHGEQGLFLKVKWTTAGEDLKASGAYKFYSPTWSFEQVGMENAKPVMRPKRLYSVGFVNNPQIPVMPLANSADLEQVVNGEGLIVDEIRALRGDVAGLSDALTNYGTSDGARKGWETRKRGMSAAKTAAAKVKSAKSAPARAAAKTRKASSIKTKLDKDGRPMPVAPDSVSLMQHPAYKKAIAEGASHEDALSEARGEVAVDKGLETMKQNAARAAAQPKLIEKPANPAAKLPPPLPKPSLAARVAAGAKKLFGRST